MTAGVAALGAQIGDPIRDLDDFEVVLDDEHRVAGLDQCPQHFEEFSDIVEMQARRRLVEDVEGASGRAPRKLFRQFDALRLATRESVVAGWPIWMSPSPTRCSVMSRIAGTARKKSVPSSTVM
jgi:hypothetical protein